MGVELDSLEIRIESTAKNAVSELDKLEGSLSRIRALTKSDLGLGNVSKEISKIKTSSSGLSNLTKGISGLLAQTFSIRKISQSIAGWVKNINEYVENVNLFQVSMGEFYDEAFEYAQLVESKMGIDSSEWMRNQGVFMSMAKGFGLANDKAYDLSESLTELTYDISSLYNEDIDSAAKRLQSALAGEIEPIRRLGISISQATLQEYAMAKGIKETVNNMTEQEKSLLRSLKLIEDANRIGAVGDFARTLESPANAIRILQQQIQQLGRALGSVFLPMLMQVLPYVQAFVSMLTDAIRSLATLVGFEMPKWDNSAWENASDAVDGVTDSVNDLKSATLGIDELNVISPEKGSGGGGASGWADNLEVPDLWDKGAIAELESRTEQIKQNIKDMIEDAPVLSALLAGLTVAGLLTGLGSALKQADALKRFFATGLILSFEVLANTFTIGKYFETNDLKWLALNVFSTAASSFLMYKMWGPTGLAIGLGVGLIANVIKLSMEVANGAQLDDPKVLLTGLLNTVMGSVGGIVVAKKLGASALSGFAVALPLSLAISLTAVQYGAIKNEQINYEGWQSTLMTLGTALATAVAGAFVFGPTGAVLGFTLGLIANLAFVAKAEKDKLVDQFWATTQGQELLSLEEEINKHYEKGIEIYSELDFDVSIPESTLSDLGLAKGLLDEIFSFDTSKNLTTGQIEELKTKIELFNGLGLAEIQAEFDTTTVKILTTKDAVQQLLDAELKRAQQEVLMEKYKELYRAQYDILTELNAAKEAQNQLEAEQMALLQPLQELLAERAALTSRINDLTAEEYDRLIEVNNAITDQEVALAAANIQYDESGNLIKTTNEKIVEMEAALKDVSEKLNLVSNDMLGMVDAASTAASGVNRALSTINTDIRVGVTLEVSGVEDVREGLGKIQMTTPVAKYAEGGYPTSGELFIAREAGPELVGSYGSRTAVANNDQIVTGIQHGVEEANMGVVAALYQAISVLERIEQKDTVVEINGEEVSSPARRKPVGYALGLTTY